MLVRLVVALLRPHEVRMPLPQLIKLFQLLLQQLIILLQGIDVGRYLLQRGILDGHGVLFDLLALEVVD